MIIPIHLIDDNGNVVMSREEFTELCNQIRKDAYAEGYEDGCSDTYMQCIADITHTSMTRKENMYDFLKKDKPQLRE